MRDLMFAAAMLLLLPMAIKRPFNAYLLWGWTALLIPTSYVYGFMGSARLNLLAALLTLLLIAFGRVKWSDYQGNRVTAWYLLMLAHMAACVALAFSGNPLNLQYFEWFAKAMLFCIVMPFFVKERWHFHAMFVVVAIGLGVHGILDGLKTIASAGSHNMFGPAGTMIADRNHLSVALALCLPILYYLYSHSARRWVAYGFLAAFGLLALAILGGQSRGGFLALAAVALWLILASRRRWSTLMVVVLLGASFYAFAPEQWGVRLATINEGTEDGSFLGRVIAWKISSAIALQNPVFGGGIHAVQVQHVWDMFKTAPSLLDFLHLPIPDFSAKAAHSIYFEVLGDAGFVGLAIFLGILFQSIAARFAIKRMVKGLGSGYFWARDMADALLLSIIAYMVGGAGVSLAYLEVIYVIIMLMELLRLHVLRASTHGPTQTHVVDKQRTD